MQRAHAEEIRRPSHGPSPSRSARLIDRVVEVQVYTLVLGYVPFACGEGAQFLSS